MSARLIPWTAFLCGAVVSVGANVLHAAETAGDTLDPGRVVAAGWAPVALLLVAEMVTRSRQAGPWWAVTLRWVGTVVVAGVAAVVSYGHMHDLLLSYGQEPYVALLLPLSVDGLVLVSSVALATPAPAAGGGHAQAGADPAPGTVPSVPEAAGAVPQERHEDAEEPGAEEPSDPWRVEDDPGAAAFYAAVDGRVPPGIGAGGTAPAGVPEFRQAPGTQGGTRIWEPAEAATAEVMVEGDKELARELIRQARRRGLPVSGPALAERHGMSERWWRDRLAEERRAEAEV